MVPIVSLLGKFNVGKTSFFNKVNNNEINLSYNFKSLTLFNNNIFKIFKNLNFLLIDTIGFNFLKRSFFLNFNLFIHDSDIILFLFDNFYGILYEDKLISLLAKKIKKYVFILLNKIDYFKVNLNIFLFFKLGFGKPYIINSSNNFNISNVIISCLNVFCFFKKCFYFNKIINKFNISVFGRLKKIKKFINFFFNKKKLFSNNKDNFYFFFFFNKIKISLNFFFYFFNYFKKTFDKKLKKISILKFIKSIIISDLFLLIIEPFQNINFFLNFILKLYKSLIFLINFFDLSLKIKIYFKNFFLKKYNLFNFYIFFICFYENFLFYIFYYIYKIFNSIHTTFKFLNFKKFIFNFNNFLNFNSKNLKVKIFYLHQRGKNPPTLSIVGKNLNNLGFIGFNLMKKKLFKFLKLRSVVLKILF